MGGSRRARDPAAHERSMERLREEEYDRGDREGERERDRAEEM